jgi:thiol-disulfide isomerase/thioredoxin
MRQLAAALALIATLACSKAGSPDSIGAGGAGEGQVAPPHLSIVDFAGLEPALAELRGEGTLLNFWAVWCPPCVAELPELVEVGEQYADRGGRVVGISYDYMVDTGGADGAAVQASVREFLAGRDLHYDSLIYDEIDHEAINERFELPGEIPVTLALDKDGRIVDRQHGRAGRERFEEMMRKALGL